MKAFFKALFKLLNNDIWYLLLPRIIVLLFFGWLVLFRPALSLHLCSLLLIFSAGALMLFIHEKLPVPFRHLIWSIPLAAAGVLIFPSQPDTAAVWFAAGICLITALRADARHTLSDRAVSITAAIAAFILIIKSFSPVWFDLYPAVSLAFFSAAYWESGNFKFLK